MNPDWRNRYELALAAAEAAGRHALQYFDQGVAIELKADKTPVTKADREAEAMIRDAVTKAFPNDGFLGEEYGEQPGETGFRWILDPIDGTKSFVRGIPIWATMIGIEYRGEMIAGVAHMPALGGSTFRALRGDGAWRDDRRLSVSKVNKLEDSQLFYSSLSWFMSAGKQSQFIELASRTSRQRGYGDFYGFMLVAQGSGEVMAEYGTSPWDLAALKPIIEEAGGKLTNWSGESTIFCRDVIASNGLLHEEVRRILNGN